MRLVSQVEKLRHNERLDTPLSCYFFSFFPCDNVLNCAELTKEGHYICGGFADHSIRLFPIHRQPCYLKNNRKRILTETEAYYSLRSHYGPIYSTRFSEDGKWLYSGSGDGTTRLWRAKSKDSVSVYSDNPNSVWDIAVSTRSNYFATGTSDCTAKLWSVARMKPVNTFYGHKSDVDSVIWHPSGSLLVTGSSDCSIRFWDIRSGECVHVLSGLSSPVTSLACSPTGKFIVGGSLNGQILALDTVSLKITGLLSCESPVWSLAVAAGNPPLLASGSNDGIIRVWNSPSYLTHEPLQAWLAPESSIATITFINTKLLMSAGAQFFYVRKI
eukprot:gnl/MRDRNA2_/MRDRNA2_85340_c0_seq2.p1 gnl/MRDRNA2_/MRDRNA2_85340_c0~~gnl/MRDRNA2_/MRDRNA2_85340_c0_seq2.p1  ORF type:complete len:329 (+),score=-20.85 gnl/MRDRNA2_/MRDRNA2_85340_c0_seq2:186-1172(+)